MSSTVVDLDELDAFFIFVIVAEESAYHDVDVMEETRGRRSRTDDVRIKHT